MNGRVRLLDSTALVAPRLPSNGTALAPSKCSESRPERTPGRQNERKIQLWSPGFWGTVRRQFMAKLARPQIDKAKVKSFLSQPIRIGFMSVPLWAAGAYFLARRLRARRR